MPCETDYDVHQGVGGDSEIFRTLLRNLFELITSGNESCAWYESRPLPRSASEKLRSDFAIWLQDHLGCQSVEGRVPIQLERGAQPLIVDLRGERYARWLRLMKTTGVWSFLTVVALANLPERPPWLTAILNPVLLVSPLLLAISYVGRVRTRQYVLVHCRDLARRATGADIRKLDEAVARAYDSTTANWKPDEVIFVTNKRGFDSEALALAGRAHIRCYRRSKMGFRLCTI